MVDLLIQQIAEPIAAGYDSDTDSETDPDTLKPIGQRSTAATGLLRCIPFATERFISPQ